MSGQLDGKAAIVTGAGSGIGEAIARLFADAGARLLAVDMQAIALQGPTVTHLVLDVTEAGSAGRIAATAEERLGGLDILVNNAGICLPGTAEDQSDESWERTMAVNVTAPFRITRACLPLLKARGNGRIINIGSIMSDFGGPGLCAYGTSKHAIAGLTKAMAADLGQFGITANYIQPGAIWSALSRPFFDDPEFRSYWEGKAPMGRIGDPEDVAAAALFLASDAAAFVSGAGIKVCGGAMARF
jgi:NAD(P)-dependent dehydrogenase (short-subunit alcohol dehydrogenase family)